jgi:hypothetical protein
MNLGKAGEPRAGVGAGSSALLAGGRRPSWGWPSPRVATTPVVALSAVSPGRAPRPGDHRAEDAGPAQPANGLIGAEISDQALCPLALTAAIRNKCPVRTVNPLITALVAVEAARDTVTQLVPVRFTRYSIT